MHKKYLALFPALLLLSASLTGCSKNDKDKIIIRVLNSADYIYEADEEGVFCSECDRYLEENEYHTEVDEETKEVTYICNKHEDCEDAEVYYDSDMMDQFIKYLEEVVYPDSGLKFDYVYDTFDTPETCYNEMMTGKSNYDVINVSDYMIQKMITNDLLQPLFDESEHDQDAYDRIRENLSDYLWGEEDSIYNNIYPKKLEYSSKEDMYDTSKKLSDYAVPYMWGTVGVMYNPNFKGYEKFSEDEIAKKFTSWEALYDQDLKGSFSIKDSVRDVYAVSILHVYRDEINDLKNDPDISSAEEFNRKLTEIFNRSDEKTLQLISEDMNQLKENSFGFEVDSGKTDMISGEKIGANLAWSGDATWAIYEAQTEHDTQIYFSLPEEGSNIFTDSWAIPKVSEHHQYALDFIDFMCQEEQAVANMDAVGYTTSTATKGVLDYIREMYDVRDAGDEYAEEAFNEYDIQYFFKGSIPEESDDPEAYVLEDAILHAWTTTTLETFEEKINGEMVTVPYAVYGRMIYAQFPEEANRPMLCMMDDFGKDNQAVIEMWQQVRTNPLPLWAIIVLAVQAAAVAALIIYIIVDRRRFNKVKAKRIISKQK